MIILSIIAAISKNNVIGKNNKLPWYLPADLKRFRKITTNHNVIMGRKSFDSLDFILPNRKNIVLSRTGKINKEGDVLILKDMNELESYIKSNEENFLIGGGQLYEQLMPYVTKMYITMIHHEFEGDTYFPEIDKELWRLTSREKGIKDDENQLDYEFLIYEKV